MGLNLLKKYYTKKIRINAAAEALAISLPLSPTVYPLNSRKYFSWVRWLSGTVTCDTRHAGQMYQGAGAGTREGKYERTARKAFEAFDGLPWKRNKLSMCWSVDYEYVYTWAPVCVCAFALKHFSLSSAISRENFT